MLEEQGFDGSTTTSAPISYFVSRYVQLCASRGYVAIKTRKGQLARNVKLLLEQGVPGRDIDDAIRIIADERKSPGVIDLVVADVQSYGVAR